MGKNFRAWAPVESSVSGEAVLESTRSAVKTPGSYSQLHYCQTVEVGMKPQCLEPCLVHRRHWKILLNESVWGILMCQCFPMAHLKTLWEGEVGREISRLWTPQIFPILLPSHDHLSISHHLYLLRLPRSPLMQGWEGSEEARSAVQGRVVGEECHMIQLWNSTSCPACLVAFSTNLNGSPDSSKLPAHQVHL